jgi:hypothetical protein
MERLELRHLRTLCAIADTDSLRRAAAAQGYSQPALTTQLQRIELYFGEPLFARSSVGAEMVELLEEGAVDVAVAVTVRPTVIAVACCSRYRPRREASRCYRA